MWQWTGPGVRMRGARELIVTMETAEQPLDVTLVEKKVREFLL